MINRDLLNSDEQAVLDLITNEKALIAIVFDTDFDPITNSYTVDYSYINDNYLNQIADPNMYRPSRSEVFFEQEEIPEPPTVQKMNMKTLEIHTHIPGQNRYTVHAGEIFQFTPKTSTSLIPTDPRFMELFQCDFGGVGFLWNYDKCNIKEEKYVFEVNAGTDSCFWFDLDSDDKIAELTARIKKGKFISSVAALQEKNRQAVDGKKSITWNEILAGLPKGMMEAVFATQDERSTRLRAYRAMQHVKEKLKLEKDLPVMILQPYYAQGNDGDVPDRPAVFRFYSQEEIKADLISEGADLRATQAAQDTITNHRGLALVVTDDQTLDLYLAQIENPTLNHPSLSLNFFKQQSRPAPSKVKKINLTTFKVHDHAPGMCRETKHKGVDYQYTTKLPTFLLPPQPQWMDLDEQKKQGGIGLLWDINDCYLHHNKYIFTGPVDEKECFWLDVDTEEKIEVLRQRLETTPVGTLDTIRAQNDKAVEEKVRIQPNTILAGLPKGKVNGVFCLQEDNRQARLKAWEMMLRIKDKLKLESNLPIFVIDSQRQYYSPKPVFRVYSDCERVLDQVNQAWEDAWNNSQNKEKFQQRRDLTEKTRERVAAHYEKVRLFKQALAKDFVVMPNKDDDKESTKPLAPSRCVLM